MKKLASKQEQFRGRVGRHTLTGFARGFADTLPKNAVILELERRSIKEMLDTLGSEVHRLEHELRGCTDEFQRKNLIDSKCRAEGRLGMLKKELPLIRGKAWSEVFVLVCDLMLQQKTLQDVRHITHTLIRYLQQKPSDRLNEIVPTDYDI